MTSTSLVPGVRKVPAPDDPLEELIPQGILKELLLRGVTVAVVS